MATAIIDGVEVEVLAHVSSRSGTNLDSALNQGVTAYNRTTNIDNTADMDKPVSNAQDMRFAALENTIGTLNEVLRARLAGAL